MYGTEYAAPPPPVSGPSIGFTPECDYYEQMKECQAVIDNTVLAVTATLGSQVVTVNAGETGQIAGFTIWAGPSTNDTLIGGTSCAIETGFRHSLTLLSPALP